jgi:hypothetical protein
MDLGIATGWYWPLDARREELKRQQTRSESALNERGCSKQRSEAVEDERIP